MLSTKKIGMALVLAVACLVPVSSNAEIGMKATITVSGYPSTLKVCATASTADGTNAVAIAVALDVKGAFTTAPNGSNASPLVAAPSDSRLNVSTLTVCTQAWNVTASTGAMHFGATAVGTTLLGRVVERCEGVSIWQSGGTPITMHC